MFLYTREAHPGENVPHHETFEDKVDRATRFRDEVGIRRPILLDDLEGTAHRAYGALPNMTWVIGRGGTILYKANWTSAANVESFLERYEAGRSRRPPGGNVSRYHTEQVEFRDQVRGPFYEHLDAMGPRARAEFERATEIWADRGDPT